MNKKYFCRISLLPDVWEVINSETNRVVASNESFTVAYTIAAGLNGIPVSDKYVMRITDITSEETRERHDCFTNF